MAYDLFISYASEDKTIADAVCARLEAAGIRCWIAPRDITAGKSYGEAIIEAIREVRAMVLVFSSNANTSVHIPKEVERAVSKGVPIIPFRIEDVAAGKSLDYFIGSVHWLDAMTPPMEKHLDNLAATIQKLLPAQTADQGVTPPQTPGWQRSVPAIPPPAPAVPKPVASAAMSQPSSSKAIWIGAAAVAIVAVIVLAVLMLRGGGNSQSVAKVADATPKVPDAAPKAPEAAPPVSTSPPPAKIAMVSKTVPVPSSPVVKATGDPIVGCYQWFNNQPVVIHADGTMVGGPFTAHWRVVNAASRSYALTWPEVVETVTVSADQHSMSGGNQYGFPTSGSRVVGSSGLVGIWRMSNGVVETIYPNGTASAASFRGKWQTVDASRGVYTLTWPDPVDAVKLSADGSHVAGANQYGVAISGVRTAVCSEN